VSASEASEVRIDDFFAAQSRFWRDIYSGDDVYSRIQRYRKSLVLSWVEQLGLPAGSAVLEVGCGAGLTAVGLAQRGLRVHATDGVPAMVELALEQAAAAGVAEMLDVTRSDAQELPFEDDSFDLVVAMGLIPWVESPLMAMREMARVLLPGGRLIVSCDNRRRLDHLLDPIWSDRLAGMRSAVGKRLPPSWRPRAVPDARYHSIQDFNHLLSTAGFGAEKGQTFGFGPFTFLSRPLLPQRLGVRLHHRMQRAADHGSSVLGRTGAQYIVMARKP
jgi:ubiquinone/menaquinone biosynthesis C-methylase UbiE